MDYRLYLARRRTLSVLLLLVMMACSEDAAGPVNSRPGLFESTVTAGVQDRVVYIPAGDLLSIEVISIEDSRCPSDLVCVWGGVARVKFSVTGIVQDMILYVGGGDNSKFPSTSTFLFFGRSYELILVDVTPYPIAENHERKKKAHVRVHRLGEFRADPGADG